LILKFKKINDSLMTTFVAGGIATLVQMAISWILYLMKITNQNPSIFHAKLLTDSVHPALSEIFLGILGNFIAGMFFAMIIIYILKYTGTDYALLKGTFIGLTNSMIQFYFFARLFKDPADILPSPITKWHLFFVYGLWGFITAYIAVKYSSIYDQKEIK
jgi:hypothetical protein